MAKEITKKQLSEFWPNPMDFFNSSVPTFRTVKEAKKFASDISWGNQTILKIVKRFEIVYCVCQYSSFLEADEYCQENLYQHIWFPTGNYKDENMQVLKVRKFIKKG